MCMHHEKYTQIINTRHLRGSANWQNTHTSQKSLTGLTLWERLIVNPFNQIKTALKLQMATDNKPNWHIQFRKRHDNITLSISLLSSSRSNESTSLQCSQGPGRCSGETGACWEVSAHALFRDCRSFPPTARTDPEARVVLKTQLWQCWMWKEKVSTAHV